MLRILHLSDIHIPKEYVKDQDFRTVKVNLLKDIEKQKKNYGQMDVAIFSGDFVDKGNTELFETNVKSFIDEILDAASIPKENIVFVPGNHDAKRPEGMVLDQIQKVRENCEITRNKDDFYFMCKRFEAFTKFSASFDSKINKSYGITTIKNNGKIFRFIRLNSALATCDKDDYNNLFITKVQLDDIMSQINEEEIPDITFLVMHHPIDWLTYEERVLLEEYLSDETKFNVDIVFNGHIHNGQVSLKSDLDNNIITLVSGIGYGKINRKESVYPEQYRYAIYNIDKDANMVKGNLRITNNKKTFIQDLSLYKKINKEGEFCIPLKVDYKLLMHQIIVPFSTKIVLNDIIMNEIDNVISNLRLLEQQLKKSINNAAKKRSKDIKGKISYFLFDFCCIFRTIFFQNVNNKDIRIHIRHYFPASVKEKGSHKVIMSLYGDETHTGSVSKIDWKKENNLIYFSYKEHRTLLSSLNYDKAYHNPNSRWNEFMTLAVTYSDYSIEDIPSMSIGISFDWSNMDTDTIEKIERKLYILSYVGLEHIVENIFEYANIKLKFKNFNFEELGEMYEKKGK